jgi:hypothetical protein
MELLGSPTSKSLVIEVLSLRPCLGNLTDLGIRDTSLDRYLDLRSVRRLLALVKVLEATISPHYGRLISSDTLVCYETCFNHLFLLILLLFVIFCLPSD